MTGVLLRSSIRHLARHPWQTGLSVLGVALGVAVVVSIDLANASARQAFLLSTDGVIGRATHQIVAGPSGLDERVYARLRVEVGARETAPVVETYVAVPAAPGRAFRLLGVDPFAEAPFRPYFDRRDRGELGDLTAFLTEPGAGLLSVPTAREIGVSPGADLGLRVSGTPRTLRVVGLLDPADDQSRQALDSLIVTDVATAQELLGAPGRLSRIDLIVPPGPGGERFLARVRAVLPPGAEVVRAAARTESVEQLTRAFSVNLTALSLLALIVGMFLVYNTATFSVVQRRSAIGLLRAVGVTRREIFVLLLGEAIAVGAVATVVGLAVGVALASGLVRLVTRTINDLYFVLSVRELTVTPWVLLRGVLLGVCATVAATVAPALEATGAPPGVVVSRSSLESRWRRAVPRVALGGGLGLTLGAGVLGLSGQHLGLAYAALFAIVLGAALVTPGATLVLAAALRPVLGRLFGLPGRMAAGGLVASLSRTGVAIAALMVALSATVGVGLMVASFRQTVVSWLESSLVADVYVSSPSLLTSRVESTLDPRIVERFREAPGVAAVGTYRGVRVEGARGPTQVVALELAPPSRAQFRFIAGTPSAIWPAFETGQAVIVSEPYAYRHGLDVGSEVRLRTDRGQHRFPVAGVFADYGSDQGVVMMSRRTYDALWDDRGISSLGLFVAPGTDVAAVIGTLRRLAQAASPQEILVRGNRALRESSLAIFDRTFAITGVLRLLTMIVAFVGVLSALLALELERARELAVLRAQGVTPRQVWALVTCQTGLMGLVAGLVAVPAGIVLALVLIFVINRRSFGWTLSATIAPEVLVQAVALAVGAALLAGLYPALRMTRTPPALALREE